MPMMREGRWREIDAAKAAEAGNDAKVLLRLPESMKLAVTELARKNRRSANSEICEAIAEHLARRGEETAK